MAIQSTDLTLHSLTTDLLFTTPKEAAVFGYGFVNETHDYHFTFSKMPNSQQLQEHRKLVIEVHEKKIPSDRFEKLQEDMGFLSLTQNSTLTNVSDFTNWFPHLRPSPELTRLTIEKYKSLLIDLIKGKLKREDSVQQFAGLATVNIKDAKNVVVTLTPKSFLICQRIAAVVLFILLSKEKQLLTEKQFFVCETFLKCLQAHLIEHVPSEICSSLQVEEALKVKELVR